MHCAGGVPHGILPYGGYAGSVRFREAAPLSATAASVKVFGRRRSKSVG